MKKAKLSEIREKYKDKAEQIEFRVDMQVQDALIRKIAEGEGVSYADAVAMCMDAEEYPRYSIAYKLASPAWTMLRKAHPKDWHDAFRRHFVLTPQEEECLETDYAYDNAEASVKLKWAREARKAKKGRRLADRGLGGADKRCFGRRAHRDRRRPPIMASENGRKATFPAKRAETAF